MVKKIKQGKNVYFMCPECKLLYEDEETASKCQQWCSQHQSCNLEIIKYAVGEKLKGDSL